MQKNIKHLAQGRHSLYELLLSADEKMDHTSDPFICLVLKNGRKQGLFPQQQTHCGNFRQTDVNVLMLGPATTVCH